MLALTNPPHNNVAPEFHPTRLCYWEKNLSNKTLYVSPKGSQLHIMQNVFHYTDISQRFTLAAGFRSEKY